MLLLVFGWLAFTVPAGGFEGDLDFWVRWSHRIDRFGLGQVYGGITGNANYLPVFLWLLAGLNRIVRGALTAENVPLVKVAALAFDLALGLALARFLSARGRNPVLALLVVANPATLYDSWVWGQIDAMHTTLVASSWLALAGGRGPLAAVLFLLALNTKLQSVIFLPFFLCALALVLGRRWRSWLVAAAACLAVEGALLAPFHDGRALRALWRNVVGIVGFFKAVSLNAYNVWYLILDDPAEVEDTAQVFHATYRTWGLLLLAAALCALAVPFLRHLWQLRRGGALQRLDEHGFFFLGLVGVACFAFPTEVHERFLHPAVVLLGIDAVRRGSYLAYAVLSGAYLVNLEAVLRWRGVGYQTVLFDPRLVAMVVLTVYGAGLWQAYHRSASRASFPS